MAENTQSVLERTAADQWKVLPSGLTVLVRPMPGYSGTHVIYATRFGSIDRDFRLGEREVHLPAGVAHFLEHKMFEDEDGDAFAKFAKTGANANAFTAFDRTCYLFTATEQLDESLDVLLGMVGHPYFTEQTIAKEQGKYTGRKPMPLPDNFERVVARWRAGEITATEAMRQTGLRANTFYRRCNQHS